MRLFTVDRVEILVPQGTNEIQLLRQQPLETKQLKKGGTRPTTSKNPEFEARNES